MAQSAEALREAVLRLDRGRSLRPLDAHVIWEGLVGGRWSIEDRFDGTERRYFVVRRRDPALARALSVHERQVLAYAAAGLCNKEIAYELGLVPSTVSYHLMRGMHHLGIQSRAALADLWSLGERGAELRAGSLERIGPGLAVLSVPLSVDERAFASLSDAEATIARLAIHGRSNAEIARLRGTSARTVANQMHAVFQKLRIGSRLELAARFAHAVHAE